MYVVFTQGENYKKFFSTLCRSEWSFEADFYLEWWTEGILQVENGKSMDEITQFNWYLQ